MVLETHLVASGVNEDEDTTVSWLLFALAVLTVIARLTVRIRLSRKLQPDDYLLLFASLTLLGANVVNQQQVGPIVAFTTDILNASPEELSNLSARTGQCQQWCDLVGLAYSALVWTTIYLAKFAYLWFFKPLVFQTRSLWQFWWVTSFIALASYIVTLLVPLPLWARHAPTPVQIIVGEYHHLLLGLTLLFAMLDILTDVMVVFLAVAIIYRVNVRNSQKIGLVLFLCLSIVLVLTEIVRMTRLYQTSAYQFKVVDVVWDTLWQQIEASLAVILVSITAVRSFFVSQKRKSLEQNLKQERRSQIAPYTKRRHSGDLEDSMDIASRPGPCTSLPSLVPSISFGPPHIGNHTRADDPIETMYIKDGRALAPASGAIRPD